MIHKCLWKSWHSVQTVCVHKWKIGCCLFRPWSSSVTASLVRMDIHLQIGFLSPIYTVHRQYTQQKWLRVPSKVVYLITRSKPNQENCWISKAAGSLSPLSLCNLPQVRSNTFWVGSCTCPMLSLWPWKVATHRTTTFLPSFWHVHTEHVTHFSFGLFPGGLPGKWGLPARPAPPQTKETVKALRLDSGLLLLLFLHRDWPRSQL